MYRITLEWHDGNRLITKTVSQDDNTLKPDIIRVGRGDESLCDIVLKNTDAQIIATVSKIHAEIFFDNNTKNFFIQNLTANRPQPNPLVVNGTKLIQGKIKLTKGSLIQLGKVNLRVKNLEEPQAAPVYQVNCSGPKSHVLEDKYEGKNCPYCGYVVYTGTMIKL